MMEGKYAIVDIRIIITDIEGLNIEAVLATANSIGEATLVDLNVIKKEKTY